MKAAKSERGDPAEVFRGETLPRAPRAEVVHPPARPAGVLRQRPVPVLDDELLVPAVRDAVGVGMVVVADDPITQRPRLGDQAPQRGLAAQRGLDGEHLRIASVMAHAVPSDEAELGVLDARRLARAHEFADARERDGDLQRRLVGGRLLLDRRRRRLPRLADAHLDRLRRRREIRLLGQAFGNRLHLAAREPPVAIGRRHLRIARLRRQLRKRDANVLLRRATVQHKPKRDGVRPVFHANDRPVAPRKAVHERDERLARRLHPEHRHHRGTERAFAVRRAGELAVEAVGQDEEARLADPCRREVRRNLHPVGRADRRRGDDKGTVRKRPTRAFNAPIAGHGDRGGFRKSLSEDEGGAEQEQTRLHFGSWM